MTKQAKKTKTNIENYNFGEKNEEYNPKANKNQGATVQVWQSPKYIESKKKAVELIESEQYGLQTSDFWILMNGTKSGKMMYSGLIISHTGCLKINDKLSKEEKFSPSSVNFVKDDAEKCKVMSYINDSQGIYEFGEISPKNCKNEYPYAMVLKRLMDRVILKNSKIGFAGIYSEAESSEFKDNDPESKAVNENNSKQKATETLSSKEKLSNLATNLSDDREDVIIEYLSKEFPKLKSQIEDCESIEKLKEIWSGKENKKLLTYFRNSSPEQYELLENAKDYIKNELTN